MLPVVETDDTVFHFRCIHATGLNGNLMNQLFRFTFRNKTAALNRVKENLQSSPAKQPSRAVIRHLVADTYLTELNLHAIYSLKSANSVFRLQPRSSSVSLSSNWLTVGVPDQFPQQKSDITLKG